MLKLFFSPETDTNSNETLKLISSYNLLIWLQLVFVIPLLNDNKLMHYYTSAGKHNQWMVTSYNFFLNLCMRYDLSETPKAVTEWIKNSKLFL